MTSLQRFIESWLFDPTVGQLVFTMVALFIVWAMVQNILESVAPLCARTTQLGRGELGLRK